MSMYSTFGDPGEGENDGSCPVEESNTRDDISDLAANFAPRGASKFQSRVRNKLPKPLSSRQMAALSALYETCTVFSTVDAFIR